MYANMMWFTVDYEPEISDLGSIRDDSVHFELFLNMAPEVQVLRNLDISMIDFDSKNYRLEYAVMMLLALVCVIAAFSLAFCSKSMFEISEDHMVELQILEGSQSQRALDIQSRKERLRQRKMKAREEDSLLRERRSQYQLEVYDITNVEKQIDPYEQVNNHSTINENSSVMNNSDFMSGTFDSRNPETNGNYRMANYDSQSVSQVHEGVEEMLGVPADPLQQKYVGATQIEIDKNATRHE